MTKIKVVGKCKLNIGKPNGEKRVYESNNSLTHFAESTMIRNLIFAEPTNGGLTEYKFKRELDDPTNYTLATKLVDNVFLTDKIININELTDLDNFDLSNNVTDGNFLEKIAFENDAISELGSYSLKISFSFTNTVEAKKYINSMGLLVNNQYIFSLLNFNKIEVAPEEVVSGNYILTFVISRI